MKKNSLDLDGLYKAEKSERLVKKYTWAKIKTVTIDIFVVNMPPRLSQRSHWNLQKCENALEKRKKKKKKPPTFIDTS